MHHRIGQLGALAAAAALAALPAVAAADTLLVQKQHTDAMSMMGHQEPAKDETVELWISKNAIARRGGAVDTLVRFDDKKLYVINHAEKTYSTIQLPFDFKSLVPPEQQPMMEQMEKMMAMNVTVTPTSETKQIGSWSAKRYDIAVTMMGMKMDIVSWQSKDVAIDYPAYREFIKNSSSLQPRSDWMKKMAEIEGYPVLQETKMTVMGSSFGTRSELVSASDKTPPPGTYEPPAGYREQKFDPMKNMQGGRGNQ
jgi:hypothetical protein